MTNFGGKITVPPLVWQEAIPANPARGLATVQNTSPRGLSSYDRDGVNNAPELLVWPFDDAPVDGITVGAFVLGGRTDAVVIPGASSLATIYVCSPDGRAQFAASES